MEIKHDKSYLYLWEGIKNTGFTHTVIGKICFEGNKDNIKTIQSIADYLEENYKMYQYKKDNGIKFRQEELYYWTNDRESAYFDVTIQDNYGIDRLKEIAAELIQHIEENYSNTNIYVRLHYTEKKDWNMINNYLENIDLNNLEINKLSQLYSMINEAGNKFTEENIEKLININDNFISQYVDKKVLWNDSIKGTIKKLRNGDFGLFKPRATKTYYPINLGKISSLVLI